MQGADTAATVLMFGTSFTLIVHISGVSLFVVSAAEPIQTSTQK